MKDKYLLLLYILFIVYLSSSKSIVELFITSVLLLLTLLLIPAKRKLYVLKTSFLSFFFFSFVVSTSYLLTGFWIREDRFDYFLMINLRSFNLTLLTFLFLRVMNLYKALDFSKTLSILLVITISHTMVYRRLFWDFMDAFKSRKIERLSRSTTLAFLRRLSLFFFEKSISASEEMHQAMKSRGFYHD
ncbi:MAG: ABC transporter permease [Aquificaceae bacterium]